MKEGGGGGGFVGLASDLGDAVGGWTLYCYYTITDSDGSHRTYTFSRTALVPRAFDYGKSFQRPTNKSRLGYHEWFDPSPKDPQVRVWLVRILDLVRFVCRILAESVAWRCQKNSVHIVLGLLSEGEHDLLVSCA